MQLYLIYTLGNSSFFSQVKNPNIKYKYVHIRCYHPVAIMCPFFTVKRFLFEFKIGWRQEEQQVFLSDSEMVYWSNWKSNMWIHTAACHVVYIHNLSFFGYFWYLLKKYYQSTTTEVLLWGCSQFFYSSLLSTTTIFLLPLVSCR